MNMFQNWRERLSRIIFCVILLISVVFPDYRYSAYLNFGCYIYMSAYSPFGLYVVAWELFLVPFSHLHVSEDFSLDCKLFRGRFGLWTVTSMDYPLFTEWHLELTENYLGKQALKTCGSLARGWQTITPGLNSELSGELDFQPHCATEASRGVIENLKRNGNQPCSLSLLPLILCLHLALDMLS